MRTPPGHTQTPNLKSNLFQDSHSFGFIGTHRTHAQLMLSIDPYASSVKLTLCGTPEEQEHSKLLMAEVMTNEVAAVKIESFTVEYFDTDCGRECESDDLLGPFIELIDRGGGYLQALNHVEWVSFCIACSRRF